MSTADATTELPGTPGSPTSIDRLETWAEATSDWINPILVKEVRQALKSWTFMATFLFLLLASWCVSVFEECWPPVRRSSTAAPEWASITATSRC